jgi:hypothetical protein
MGSWTMILLNRILRGVIIVLVALTIAACAIKPEVNIGGPFHVAEVQVVGTGAPGQLEDLRGKTLLAAARVPVTNNPVLLRMQIARYHEKNPAMSLLVGDSNSIEIVVSVIQPQSGTVISQFRTVSTVDGAVNGVIGAVMAATSNENKVMARLNSQAANDILEHVFGSSVWRHVS